jgi:hypothetical protein
MTVDLELESTAEFKDGFLKEWILCPSGEAGHGVAGDMDREHDNLTLEEGISKNDQTYDSSYVRDVLSPNTGHLRAHKKAMLAGAGLAKKKTYHTDASVDLELRRLLTLYKDTHTHTFMRGRSYDDPGTARDVDDYTRGMAQLGLDERKGKLRKWIDESTYMRDIIKQVTNAHSPEAAPAPTSTPTATSQGESAVEVAMQDGTERTSLATLLLSDALASAASPAVDDPGLEDADMEADEGHESAEHDQDDGASSDEEEEDEDVPLQAGRVRIVNGELIVEEIATGDEDAILLSELAGLDDAASEEDDDEDVASDDEDSIPGFMDEYDDEADGMDVDRDID